MSLVATADDRNDSQTAALCTTSNTLWCVDTPEDVDTPSPFVTLRDPASLKKLFAWCPKAEVLARDPTLHPTCLIHVDAHRYAIQQQPPLSTASGSKKSVGFVQPSAAVAAVGDTSRHVAAAHHQTHQTQPPSIWVGWSDGSVRIFDGAVRKLLKAFKPEFDVERPASSKTRKPAPLPRTTDQPIPSTGLLPNWHVSCIQPHDKRVFIGTSDGVVSSWVPHAPYSQTLLLWSHTQGEGAIRTMKSFHTKLIVVCESGKCVVFDTDEEAHQRRVDAVTAARMQRDAIAAGNKAVLAAAARNEQIPFAVLESSVADPMEEAMKREQDALEENTWVDDIIEASHWPAVWSCAQIGQEALAIVVAKAKKHYIHPAASSPRTHDEKRLLMQQRNREIDADVVTSSGTARTRKQAGDERHRSPSPKLQKDRSALPPRKTPSSVRRGESGEQPRYKPLSHEMVDDGQRVEASMPFPSLSSRSPSPAADLVVSPRRDGHEPPSSRALTIQSAQHESHQQYIVHRTVSKAASLLPDPTLPGGGPTERPKGTEHHLINTAGCMYGEGSFAWRTVATFANREAKHLLKRYFQKWFLKATELFEMRIDAPLPRHKPWLLVIPAIALVPKALFGRDNAQQSSLSTADSEAARFDRQQLRKAIVEFLQAIRDIGTISLWVCFDDEHGALETDESNEGSVAKSELSEALAQLDAGIEAIDNVIVRPGPHPSFAVREAGYGASSRTIRFRYLLHEEEVAHQHPADNHDAFRLVTIIEPSIEKCTSYSWRTASISHPMAGATQQFEEEEPTTKAMTDTCATPVAPHNDDGDDVLKLFAPLDTCSMRYQTLWLERLSHVFKAVQWPQDERSKESSVEQMEVTHSEPPRHPLLSTMHQGQEPDKAVVEVLTEFSSALQQFVHVPGIRLL